MFRSLFDFTFQGAKPVDYGPGSHREQDTTARVCSTALVPSVPGAPRKPSCSNIRTRFDRVRGGGRYMNGNLSVSLLFVQAPAWERVSGLFWTSVRLREGVRSLPTSCMSMALIPRNQDPCERPSAEGWCPVQACGNVAQYLGRWNWSVIPCALRSFFARICCAMLSLLKSSPFLQIVSVDFDGKKPSLNFQNTRFFLLLMRHDMLFHTRFLLDRYCRNFIKYQVPVGRADVAWELHHFSVFFLSK